jgi:TetR/AcrR family transcriptional regulator, transcriptional repressor for nem operon
MPVPEPVTDKGRATRNRVLDAAAALVFEHGVAGTTLDDVRAAANVSKGQISCAP